MNNEEHIQEAFAMFYKVANAINSWNECELKCNIIELNKTHLLDNLNRALVQINKERKQ